MTDVAELREAQDRVDVWPTSRQSGRSFAAVAGADDALVILGWGVTPHLARRAGYQAVHRGPALCFTVESTTWRSTGGHRYPLRAVRTPAGVEPRTPCPT